MLCFRCEHRANYLEKHETQLPECAAIYQTVYKCFLYRPIRPIIVDKTPRNPDLDNDNDNVLAKLEDKIFIRQTTTEDVGLAVKQIGKYYLPIWTLRDKKIDVKVGDKVTLPFSDSIAKGYVVEIKYFTFLDDEPTVRVKLNKFYDLDAKKWKRYGEDFFLSYSISDFYKSCRRINEKDSSNIAISDSTRKSKCKQSSTRVRKSKTKTGNYSAGSKDKSNKQ